MKIGLLAGVLHPKPAAVAGRTEQFSMPTDEIGIHKVDVATTVVLTDPSIIVLCERILDLLSSQAVFVLTVRAQSLEERVPEPATASTVHQSSPSCVSSRLSSLTMDIPV